MIKYLFLISLLNCLLLSTDSVKNLDIDKFMGRWYVISNIPNFIENQASNAYDEYVLNSDGTIEIYYHAIKNEKPVSLKQRATIADTINNSTWELKLIKPFIPFLKLPYKVILLDQNYQYMVIGYPKNKYGWIMARSNKMKNDLYHEILNTLEKKFGYNKNKFTRVVHN